MHFSLQFKTRFDHVSLKMETIKLRCAQMCVLQCVQNMRSLGRFPAQTLMPLFGNLLCARFRAQETAVNVDPLPPMESPAALYPRIKHPAASYQGASSPTWLRDCPSPFLVFRFSFQMGEILGAVSVVQGKAQEWDCPSRFIPAGYWIDTWGHHHLDISGLQ